MPKLKVGIQLTCLQLPFVQALHTAAALGAEAVEIDARREFRPGELSRTGLRQVRKMLEDRNLRVCALRFHTRRGYDVSADLERRVEATKQALRLAHDLGCSIVVNQVGRVPADATGEAWDQLRAVLLDLGDYGQRTGAFLAAETGAEEGAALARLVAALPAGYLAVNLNPGRLLVNGFSPREALEALGPHIVHVYATDAVRDNMRRQGVQTPLGQGSVDFLELVGLLQEHAYHGYFTIDRDQCEDSVGEIGQAVKYLHSL